jgi:threonine/homoserine/homoserine lactone efflux protein
MDMKQDQRPPLEPDIQTGIQWGVGCLVGGAALIGALILVLLVSIAAQPPAWLQIVLGLALVGGAVCLSWLFVSALRRSQQAALPRRPTVVSDQAERAQERPHSNE